MKIERVTIKGFRCFGPEGTVVTFDDSVTALVGGNGAGKTALFQALSRLFGVTASERRVQLQDFHVPYEKHQVDSGARLCIDVILGFPELADDDDVSDAVPEFFRQMAASAPGKPLKARIVLKATWTDDRTPSGYIDEDVRWVQSLEDEYNWESDSQKASPVQRSTIQMIYIPATRDAQDQVSTLLKGRIWQAAKWSDEFRKAAEKASKDLQELFQSEIPASFVQARLERRWKQVHDADTDTKPLIRLIEDNFEAFVRKATFTFVPDEAGQEKSLSRLSDGQRSLFYIALTAATLEVERDARTAEPGNGPFEIERLKRTHLTILAIEEPENSLSPFFLSRVVSQVREIGIHDGAQVILSSHSSAILSRIDPREVRFFRQNRETRCSIVNPIRLPTDDMKARQFIRLAIRAYPELYFARAVILAEGDSERLVIPRVADAKGISLDPSFVPIVPLGGRYCLHFWRLLRNLEIPYVTLLDFDIGRKHGGAKTVRAVVEQLTEVGVDFAAALGAVDASIDLESLAELDDAAIWTDYEENCWIQALERVNVFLSDPLDLDFAMLRAFPHEYQQSSCSGSGPRRGDDAVEAGKDRTLKTGGDSTIYGDSYDEAFRWYPYLFLSRSKPETHLAALSSISKKKLRDSSPDELHRLIDRVGELLGLAGEVDDARVD